MVACSNPVPKMGYHPLPEERHLVSRHREAVRLLLCSSLRGPRTARGKLVLEIYDNQAQREPEALKKSIGSIGLILRVCSLSCPEGLRHPFK